MNFLSRMISTLLDWPRLHCQAHGFILANKPLFSRSGFLFIMFTQYNLEIVQEEEFEKGSPCLCICVHAQNCWCFSFGPCQAHLTLQCKKGGKDPVIPESSKAKVSTRQTEADGSSFCFRKACRTVCLNLNICGGQIHLVVKTLLVMSRI